MASGSDRVPAVEDKAGSSPANRAQGHREFLQRWEVTSTLSERQMDLCAAVEAAVAAPWTAPTAKSRNGKIATGSDPTAEPEGAQPHESPASKKGPLVPSSLSAEDDIEALRKVRTAEDFRSWHQAMERRIAEANEEKYRKVVQGLRDDEVSVAEMLAIAFSLHQKLDQIVEQRRAIFETTGRFRDDCENLVAERKRLGELADAVRKRLKYFEELETLTARFGGGKESIPPTNPEFVRLLHRLDECIAYASSSTGAVAEADGYLVRFLELQRRAFTMIRDYIIGLLRSTSAQVAKELNEAPAAGRMIRETELTDASKEYLRFRTVAPKVKSLLLELHSRASAGRSGNDSGRVVQQATDPARTTRVAALALLGDCEECFVEQRRRLLEASVVAHIKSLGDVQNTIALARAGANYILQLCHMEASLFERFFPADSDEEESVTLLGELKLFSNIYYEELRPRVLQENELDRLVYLIEVLKMEVLGDEVPRRGVAGEALANAVTRCIADTQERIIFRAEVFIRDEIRGFLPTTASLNYPDIILDKTAREAAAASVAATRRNARRGDANGTEHESGMVGLYATWYPPVERTLRLLSMLYRCVDRQVFAGIAQEAVAICVQSILIARGRIASSQRADAEDHAQLFLVWQLLMLREQISPFDVEFAYTEKELDFVELRSLLGNVIRGQVTLRALTTPPAVREKLVDSKRELEREVRAACEGFILKTTRVFLDPILAFLAKCNSLPGLDEKGPDSSDTFAQLKNQSGSFAAPERVHEMWAKVSSGINEDLATIVQRMKIYISKQSSCAVLIRPIRAYFAEAASELLSVLQTRYSLEERELIGIDGASVENLLTTIDGIVKLPERA